MEVRAKKALGQHFLTDQAVARRIVDALSICDTAEPTIPLHPQGTGERIPPEPPSVASLRKVEDVGRLYGDGVSSPDRLRPRSREWEGPAPSGVGGMSDAKSGEETLPPEEGGRSVRDVLEIGPGMGVLTQYLLKREDIDLKAVEVDGESVAYLLTHFPDVQGKLLQADFLRIDTRKIFPGSYRIIGNFPYNISSQIFFKILDDKDRVPEVVCMIQKEVAERIAEPPGSKTYGILSVLLQAWYDIEYCFSVGPGAFAPPPKVQSAVIRLRRNTRLSLGCDEKLFKQVVKTAFNQRRKTLRNALKPLLKEPGLLPPEAAALLDLRAERLGVEDFILLTKALSAP